MALFIVTFSIMMLAVGGMAVGVIFGRTPIAGSCGGLNAVDGSGACQSCSRPCSARKKAQARIQAQAETETHAHTLRQVNLPVQSDNRSGER